MENKLRVLVVSQHFWPETFRISEVVESLRACGCEVDVLSGQPNYPGGRIFEGYTAFGAGTQTHPDGYLIHRVPVVPRGKGGGMRRVANYVSFVASAAIIGPYLTRSRPYDVVFVYAISPILQGLAGWVFRKIKGAALVIWVQDLWPDSLEATGFVKNRKILSAVAALTRFIYRRADLLLAQSRGFVAEIRGLAGSDVPVVYHPNPGDLTLVQGGGNTGSTLELQPGFNVVFAGNLGSVQALDTILDSAEQISDPNIRIVLVGTGSRSNWLRSEVTRRGLRNVELAGRFPAEAMPGIFAQASALLVTLNRADNLSRTIPSKIPSYLAAARPVIACLDGEGADVIREAGAGLTVPAEDAKALASAIIALKQMPEDRRAAMAQAGRAYFDRYLAPDKLALALVQHFREALDGRKGDAASGKYLRDANDETRHS
ncbi:glycosyltransferase family 4 protein [Aurantimonas sp. A3-2-R12]|uniref:glycosyltransferase family 4 protein n=1 Tax=Aurantimonas sp. A3-2-R12 TaxID=3114362 RepID=UPI002E190C6C|nr:glycosyltransferase family 4 protein [Aurantimonas sp. A3-2-R12]